MSDGPTECAKKELRAHDLKPKRIQKMVNPWTEECMFKQMVDKINEIIDVVSPKTS